MEDPRNYRICNSARTGNTWEMLGLLTLGIQSDKMQEILGLLIKLPHLEKGLKECQNF